MPFSNDEEIVLEDRSRFPLYIFGFGFGLNIISLFNLCFCPEGGCRSSIEALLIGWMAMFNGGAAITWLANPLLVTAWILLLKSNRSAWFFSLISAVLSALFFEFPGIVENEAGYYSVIKSIEPGYWLWLSSSAATFIGSLMFKLQRR